MPGTLAPQIHYKNPSEVRNVGVDFTDDLATAELLTGTPTVSSDIVPDLTYASIAVITVATVINGRTVAIGKGVTFRVSGGTDGDDHLLTVSCGTNSTPTETVVGTCRLRIRL